MNALVLAVALLAAPPAPAAKLELLHTEVDAMGWVFDALTKYPAEDRPYIRFAYIPPWADSEWIGALDYSVNSACSQSPVLVRGDRHAKNFLIGYNLARLAPDPVQRARLIAEWDRLATRCSVFHVPSINLVDTVVVENVEQRDPRTGKVVQVPTNRTVQTKQTVVVLAPHLKAALATHATDPERSQRVDALVASITQSTGAVYRADFLIEQLLTSARGSYPEFRQIEFKSSDPSVTPLQAHLRKRGFFLEASKALRGDKGALLLASDVTGKSRVVLTTTGISSRLPLAATFDFRDATTRPDKQFIRNLITFEFNADAQELLVPMSCGLIEGVLADGQGRIQRVAPPDVVADFTKPNGHTKELEMGMSCIVCHAAESGYKTAHNDMGLLLGADADYFGDEIVYAGKTLTREEAVAVVTSRYGDRIDDPDGVLGRARRDLNRAVMQLTDYKVTADGPNAVQSVGLKVREIYHAYRYRKIDAQRACLELGVRVSPEDALATLRTLVPPPADGTSEDIVIALLKNGLAIKRDDMDAIYVEMARRAVATRNTLVEK